MDISCVPTGMISLLHPKQGIEDIVNAGFENIMLNTMMFRAPEEQKDLLGSFGKVLEQCGRKGIHCQAAAAPHLPRNSKRNDLNDLLVRLTEESIKLCQAAGCRYLIVRPLFAGIPENEIWARNRAYYLHLAVLAKESHLQILLENQCKDFNHHLIRGVCSDEKQAAAWIDELNAEVGEERFGFCMDAGICTLCGQNMQDFAVTLGNRIKAVILRDCNGYKETSLLPFTSSGFEDDGTDWLGLIRGLRAIGFDGQLILDFSDNVKAFSPLLRPQLMLLAKEVAEYFVWQIEMERLIKSSDSIVLFGAGNMCRNYIKCYGEKYPPLFTCDNNASLWGTIFCGLEVKPPECLKDLPENCVIYICNMYYREIKQQLREMGVSNKIEFFNDEYMPSFYFDRLKREKNPD